MRRGAAALALALSVGSTAAQTQAPSSSVPATAIVSFAEYRDGWHVVLETGNETEDAGNSL